MLSVPLPIVVALMLAMVMLINREALLELPSGRWFLTLLGVYCVVLVLIGIRWTGGVKIVMPLLPLLAVCWCMLNWIAFRSLSRTGPAIDATDWPHLLPLVAVVVALFAAPIWLEAVIVATNLFYAWLLIGLAKGGEDGLPVVKFAVARNCLRAVWISAGMLIYFAVIEIIIALDFELWQGRHAALIVTLANVPSIFLLGLVAAGAGKAGARIETGEAANPASENQETGNQETGNQETENQETENQETGSQAKHHNGQKPASETPTQPEPDYAAQLEQLTGLLVGQMLYADSELNLQRLARKAGIPSRQVSRAVNGQTGLNVSQWVNEARINAACKLLHETDATIIEIMQKVGFATKSNFNREFRRVTGESPGNWRLSSRRG